ncbi:unnamed protein product [Lathyrus sativus]|nr:unnamed protein product [Lathyrus sativus]
MSLQGQLDRFKKQQEKCQSTLSGIAASQVGGRKPSNPVVAHASINGRNSTTGIKFSKDTERLQQINTIRKAHVGAQMKRVIDMLFETRKAYTPEQIIEACYVDMRANKDVFDNLRKNPKVHYDGQRFSYKAKYGLKDKTELLQLVRKYPEGIAVIDLKDAYPSVMEDLQALKVAGQI